MKKKDKIFTIDTNDAEAFRVIKNPEYKGQCEIFGSKDWIWQSEHYPNWFWRLTQYLVFGNKWRKIK